MTDEQMIKEIIERRRQWGKTRDSDFVWLMNHIEMQQKLIVELKQLNRDTNMEIGRHSQAVLRLASLNAALSKELEGLANVMLNGEENSQTEK